MNFLRALIKFILMIILVVSSTSVIAGNFYKWCEGQDYSGRSPCSVYKIINKSKSSACIVSFKEKTNFIQKGKVIKTRVRSDQLDCCNYLKTGCGMGFADFYCENVCGKSPY